jgi:prevent-host-death family protein
MKTATVRELRNRYTQLLEWIGAGEEIVITQRGKRIARLCPERGSQSSPAISWLESAALRRDRTQEMSLSAEESANLISDASGKW